MDLLVKVLQKLSREGAKIFAADIELTDSQTFKR